MWCATSSPASPTARTGQGHCGQTRQIASPGCRGGISSEKRKEMRHDLRQHPGSLTGRLLFAGQDTVELAWQTAPPLPGWTRIGSAPTAGCIPRGPQALRLPGPGPLRASKGQLLQRIYEIVREEGMGIDVRCPLRRNFTPPSGRASPLARPTFTATTRPMRTSATVWITVSAILWRITWRSQGH